MVFSRKDYWSGLPFPSPGDLGSDPGIEPRSPTLQADALLSEPPGKPTSNLRGRINLTTLSGKESQIHKLLFPLEFMLMKVKNINSKLLKNIHLHRNLHLFAKNGKDSYFLSLVDMSL